VSHHRSTHEGLFKLGPRGRVEPKRQSLRFLRDFARDRRPPTGQVEHPNPTRQRGIVNSFRRIKDPSLAHRAKPELVRPGHLSPDGYASCFGVVSCSKGRQTAGRVLTAPLGNALRSVNGFDPQTSDRVAEDYVIPRIVALEPNPRQVDHVGRRT